MTQNNTLDHIIRERLEHLFEIDRFDLHDESQNHAGHQGNSGGGHYQLLIISNDFVGMSKLQRHRTIYNALKDLFPNQIHALGIKAITNDEF